MGIDHGLAGKTPHGAGQQRETRHTAFVAALEQHLQPDTDAEKRALACGLQYRRAQSARVHLAHTVRHRALTRKHHAVCARHARGIGGHLDLRLRRHVFEGFRDRAQVAHTVIDDRDAHCKSQTEGTPRAHLSLKEWNPRRADRAPAPCAAPARTP